MVGQAVFDRNRHTPEPGNYDAPRTVAMENGTTCVEYSPSRGDNFEPPMRPSTSSRGGPARVSRGSYSPRRRSPSGIESLGLIQRVYKLRGTGHQGTSCSAASSRLRIFLFENLRFKKLRCGWRSEASGEDRWKINEHNP